MSKALRVCRECGRKAHTEEDLENFKKQKYSHHGRQNLCKPCHRTESKEWKLSHPGYMAQYMEGYRKR